MKTPLLISILLLVSSFALCEVQTYSISLRTFPLHKTKVGKERVVSFNLRYIGAHVSAVHKVPEDGDLDVNNWSFDERPQWTGRTNWQLSHGAGALSIDDFKEFIQISITEPKEFKIELELFISDFSDEEDDKPRTVKLGLKDLVLKSIKR